MMKCTAKQYCSISTKQICWLALILLPSIAFAQEVESLSAYRQSIAEDAFIDRDVYDPMPRGLSDTVRLSGLVADKIIQASSGKVWVVELFNLPSTTNTRLHIVSEFEIDRRAMADSFPIRFRMNPPTWCVVGDERQVHSLVEISKLVELGFSRSGKHLWRPFLSRHVRTNFCIISRYDDGRLLAVTAFADPNFFYAEPQGIKYLRQIDGSFGLSRKAVDVSVDMSMRKILATAYLSSIDTVSGGIFEYRSRLDTDLWP